MTTDQDYSALPGLLAELRALGVSASVVHGGVEAFRRRIWQWWPLGPSQVERSRAADRLELDTQRLGLERGPAFELALREHALCLNSFDMLAVGRPVERDEQLALQREVGADGPRWAAAGMAAWTQPRRRSQAPGMLAKLGAATQAILEARGYDGVALGPLLDAAMAGTRLYRPGEAEAQPWPATTGAAPTVEVTEESTLAASRRLTQAHARSVVALNFASARNPGGGWLGGARAQEESLARASGLVPCLESQPTYYEVNRRERSLLYSDHLIYSPDVPVFRDDAGELLPAPWTVAFITSPAPNCGALRQNQPASMADVPATLARRVRQVLKVAALHGHRALVLGAWGCGAFRCDPHLVAKVFAEALAEPEPRAAFEHVTFAIKGGHEQTLPAFRAAFED